MSRNIHTVYYIKQVVYAWFKEQFVSQVIQFLGKINLPKTAILQKILK